MTLFAALTTKDGDASSSGPSLSSPPLAIQLHSVRAIDFLNGETILLAAGDGSSAPETSSGEEGAREGSASSDDNVCGGEGPARSRKFSTLSYQALQTQRDDVVAPGTSGAPAGAWGGHSRPDLGVWDCRVLFSKDGSDNAEAMLLKRMLLNSQTQAKQSNSSSFREKKKAEESIEMVGARTAKSNDSHAVPPPVIMAVDFSHPRELHPTIELMRSVILNLFDSNDQTTSSTTFPQKACTTSIQALQSSAFGKTLIQEEIDVEGDGTSSGKSIALILAVIVPSAMKSMARPSSTAEEFKERQTRALLLYHLHKFALETNCTLCFVGERESRDSTGGVSGGNDGEEKKGRGAEAAMMGEIDPLLGRNTTMSINELGVAIRRVALGLSPVEKSGNGSIVERRNIVVKEEKAKVEVSMEDSVAPTQRPPSIHLPGSHDAELIHGAYLRNASFEGGWDATKDDLDVALPPQSSKDAAAAKAEKSMATTGKGGDEGWLLQLASSIGLSSDASMAPGGEALTPTAVDRRERLKKEKSSAATKKRASRSMISRSKDSKPKDEKEVMNFFDNLLKK